MFLVKWLVKVLFGTLAALLMSMLFACGILPGFSRLAIFPEIPFSIWGLTTGILVTLLLFCFWRPKQEVFFDRICINPEDQKLKSDAIFSLAGILKASKEAVTKKNEKSLDCWIPLSPGEKTCHLFCWFFKSNRKSCYKGFKIWGSGDAGAMGPKLEFKALVFV